MYYERYCSATEQLRNSIKNNPRNAESWHLLTHCYLKDDTISSFWDSMPDVRADLENTSYIECAKGDVVLRHGKKDSAAIYLGHDNKKWLVEAYRYLAAYEANTEKNFPEALNYLESLLVQDPEIQQQKDILRF